MRKIAAAASAFGVADSLYLLCSHVFCFGACEVNVLPFPAWIACAAAALWFAAGLLFAFVEPSKKPIAAWAAVGMAGVTFFAGCALVLRHFCPYCIAAYAAAITAVCDFVGSGRLLAFLKVRN